MTGAGRPMGNAGQHKPGTVLPCDTLHAFSVCTPDAAQMLINSSIDYAIYMLDLDGTIKSWNPGAQRIKGYRPQEIIGRNFSVLYTANDVRAGKPAEALEIARTSGSFQGEGWRVRKDGTRLWAGVTIDAMHDFNGHVVGYAKITHDASRAQAIAIQLRREKQILTETMKVWKAEKLIADEAKALAVEAKVEAAREKALADEAKALAIEAKVLADQAKAVAAAEKELADEAKSRAVAAKLIADEARAMAIEAKVIADEAKALAASEKVIADEAKAVALEVKRAADVAKSVADHEKLLADAANILAVEARAVAQQARIIAEEAKLVADKANLAKSAFLARMSHEIRTPMNGIIGFTTLVLESELTVAQRQHMTHLYDAGKSLMAIINDVLDFSKIEAGKLQLESIAFAPRDVVEGAVEIIRTDAAAKGLKLHVHVGEVPAWVVGDPTRLRQVLLNLLINALKFTPRGHVSISLKPDARDRTRLCFEVADSGIGIAPEKQHLLFNDFAQISTSTTRQYGGTGLGLAISQRLVRAMGGAIGVTSNEGQGASFWFSAILPECQAPRIAKRGPANTTSRRVLVVDDNEINQIVTAALLKSDGHSVVLASDGQEAVEAMKAGSFDLILMDMQMPVMNGIDATRAIRRLPGAARNIPIIALTANALNEDGQRCREAGMNDHLAKPIDRDSLRRAIDTWGKPPEGRLSA